jgi:hypothetical protein
VEEENGDERRLFPVIVLEGDITPSLQFKAQQVRKWQLSKRTEILKNE